MDSCIDIYSRLLIATITFVVPIIITLLSTFAAGENRRKELARTTEEEISKRAAEEVQTNPQKIRETIYKTSEQYKQIDKKTKSELALLNPIIQFWYIFSSLSLALVCLLVYFLVIKDTWKLYNHNLSIIFLLISGFSYLVAIFFIIRILYTISETKKIIENK
jgi:hypothetical protein